MKGDLQMEYIQYIIFGLIILFLYYVWYPQKGLDIYQQLN